MVSPAFPKSLKEDKNCPGLQASAFPSVEWAEGPRSSGPWDSDLGRDLWPEKSGGGGSLVLPSPACSWRGGLEAGAVIR